jgi:hypothetical protein
VTTRPSAPVDDRSSSKPFHTWIHRAPRDLPAPRVVGDLLHQARRLARGAFWRGAMPEPPDWAAEAIEFDRIVSLTARRRPLRHAKGPVAVFGAGQLDYRLCPVRALFKPESSEAIAPPLRHEPIRIGLL